jgi:ribosomal protein S18 acetylase RimI-like enzyme
MPSITYSFGERPDARTIVDLYRTAGLRRPIDDADRIARMYAGSTLVVTARDGARLIGILRGWTDGAFDGYICDLAVHPEFQQLGIGRELLRRCVSQSSSEVQWVLRASAMAATYYEHLGWQRIENGWYWPRD